MPLPAHLSQYDVMKERALGFPFVSPAYDRFSINGALCCDLLDNIIPLSETSTAAYFRVVNGSGCTSSVRKAEIRAFFVDLMRRLARKFEH